MGEFNRAICLSNIQFLAKQNGVPIGELEAGAGVSVGYFSRLMKPDASACPSVDVVWRIAQRFGVSMSTLVSADLRRQSAADHYRQKFLQKLIQDTEAAQWNGKSGFTWYQSPSEPERMIRAIFKGTRKPSSKSPNFKSFLDSWDLDPGSLFVSWDPKAPGEVFLDDEILICDLPSGGVVYVVRVCTDGAQDPRTDIELYMETEEEQEFVCSTRNEFLADDLATLETMARAAATNGALSEPIRSAINKYMETD